LVAVIRVLLLVAELFFLGEGFPLGLDFDCLVAPLFTDDL